MILENKNITKWERSGLLRDISDTDKYDLSNLLEDTASVIVNTNNIERDQHCLLLVMKKLYSEGFRNINIRNTISDYADYYNSVIDDMSTMCYSDIEIEMEIVNGFVKSKI